MARTAWASDSYAVSQAWWRLSASHADRTLPADTSLMWPENVHVAGGTGKRRDVALWPGLGPDAVGFPCEHLLPPSRRGRVLALDRPESVRYTAVLLSTSSTKRSSGDAKRRLG